MLRLVSWNINQRPEAWHDLVASAEYDIAMLQEAKPPPAALASQVQIDSAPPWMTARAELRRDWHGRTQDHRSRTRIE